jgi:sialate O-acetylesterase
MIPRIPFRTVLFCSLLTLLAFAARADVKLHGLFTDHMVLQRDTSAPIWGWADDGEEVTVEFRGKKVSTRAKGGKWLVKLGKFKAGGPDELKVSGKNSLTLKNVLVGEVWIASGQSNMEWPMRASFEPGPDILGANNPNLRLYTVPKLKANAPVEDVASAWKETSPSAVSNFSAVAYYFGTFLQKELGVPVGVIHTSWGGSPAEVWMREEVLASNPDYKRDILDSYSGQKKRIEDALAKFEQEQAEARREGKPFNKRRPGAGWKPSELYNGMIAPLIPYAFKGAIWYQGESNAGRAHQYRALFADMVTNWRDDWDRGDFPFLQVQLAPFMAIKDQPAESAWAELREAQVHATEVLRNVGVAVITDQGNPKDIHPVWKKPVGYRLSLLARGMAYEQDIHYSGPVYRKMKVKGDKIVLTFDHVGDGLFGGPLRPDEARVIGVPETTILKYNTETGWIDAPLAGFAIAGEDRKFVWAKAEIDGDKVIVSSPEVPKPVAVRYGWADYPVVNLYCTPGVAEPGLPASPFRTDDWPMTTAPKKEAKP